MKNKQLHKSLCYIVLVLLLLIVTVISGGFTVSAFAETDKYSNVLDDLKKDENFNALRYPVIPNNYTPEVIQIAESADGELFIYVYHPCGETQSFKATSINFSTTLHANLKYENYDLQFLNLSGTLYKYKVVDFKVKKDAVRYYDIASIYRKWNKDVDGELPNGNTASEKAFAVGQRWTACTIGDEVTYAWVPVEVIEIEQEVGFRRYPNGINPLILSGSAVDAHYLLFSSKFQIDELYSVDISFITQPYAIKKGNTTLGSKEKHFRTLYSDEYAENEAGGWFGKKAKWDRIVSTEEFLNSGLEFKADEIATFNRYQWVLNFYETEFTLDNNTTLSPLITPWFAFGDMIQYWAHNSDPSYLYDISSEYVSNVTVLRLEGTSNGEAFNLGVVSDKQTGSGKPSNPSGNIITDTPWWVWLIVIAIIVIVVLLILSFVFPAVRAVLGVIFKRLWLIISAPFKAIGKLFTAIQTRCEERKAQKQAEEARKQAAAKRKRKSSSKNSGGRSNGSTKKSSKKRSKKK